MIRNVILADLNLCLEIFFSKFKERKVVFMDWVGRAVFVGWEGEYLSN